MKRLKWRVWGGLILAGLVLLVTAATCNGTTGAEREVREAIAKALPDMKRYQLVTIDNEAEIVAQLEAAIGDPGPVRLMLPIVDANNRVKMHQWTAYHVNLRELDRGLLQPDSNIVAAAEINLLEPSRTFQGLPNWDDETFFATLQRWEKEPPAFDENLYQASVLNIIGGRLEGAYFGNPDSQVVSVLESLENLLEPRFGTDEAKRLAGLTANNYIVYNQADFQPPVLHGEQEFPAEQLESVDAAFALEPQLHTNTRTLRPVMVADSTIYDPDTGVWALSNWFARVDAAANRQNAYLWLASIAPNVTAPGFSGLADNNRIFVRTKIAGYLVLTPYGKSQLLPYPAASNVCNGSSSSYIGKVTSLSNNYRNHLNEYWMWWTRQYGGGCAWIATLGRTPRNGAVGWSGFGDGTVDWTSFVFMHESGHIIGGTHTTNTAASPETLASHRCRLLGIWPIGPTGPSLMSYASGTRTYCFAASDHTASNPFKRNLTKVAEYLHNNLQ